MSEASFDELIHAPLRLQICAMLAPVQSLPFADMRDTLDVSDSVLSKHLSALSDAGYVQVARVRANARSRRQVTLTGPGRRALYGHLAALREIAARAEPATAPSTEPAIAPSTGPAIAPSAEPSIAADPLAEPQRGLRRETGLDPRLA